MRDEMFVVDMEHHYIPEEALKLVGKTVEYDHSIGRKRIPKAYEIITDIDTHLRWMDDSGIDMAILSTAPFSNNGQNFCRICNEGYSEVIRRYPDRFKGMIHVYPFDSEKTKDEIVRGVEELGLRGIAVVSSYQDMTIDSPRMDPIYEAAIKYDMPIFVHPTIRNKLWGGENYELYLLLSREYDIIKSFVEIIYGVLPRFPGLKVIFSHLGGGLPALKGRLLNWHQPKDFPLAKGDRGSSIDRAKESGLIEDFEMRLQNMVFNAAGFGGWLPVMRFSFEQLGADHLCFGTDYPYEFGESRYVKGFINGLKDLEVSEGDKKRFFHENLERLFQMK